MNDVEARLARLEERIAGFDRAISIQAVEYARRLDELNHAHVRAVSDREIFLKRELWDQRNREIDTWRTTINTEMALTRGKALGLTLAMGVAVTIITLLIHYLKV